MNCESDPIPTHLLKAILPVVLNLLTELVNRSLQTGTFPLNPKEVLSKTITEEDHPRADRQELIACVKCTLYWKNPRMGSYRSAHGLHLQT